MNNQSSIATIVINWNLKSLTTRCLESLEKSSMRVRTIVVDNGSRDGSVTHLRKRFPDIELISSATNIGFGSACNLAIQQALQDPGCDFVFLLNNDAILHPRAVSMLYQAAESYPRAGIFGPKIYYSGQRDQIWYAGSQQRSGVLAAKVPGRGKIDRGQFDECRQVDYVFGASMFIRRQVFERIGLFDERYFLYLEDLDFCLRARQAGFQLLYTPQACVWHVGSASTAQNLAMRRFHHVRSTLLFLSKHITWFWVLPAAIFWSGVFIKMLWGDILDGHPDLVHAYSSALAQGIDLWKSPGHPAKTKAPLVPTKPPASNTRRG